MSDWREEYQRERVASLAPLFAVVLLAMAGGLLLLAFAAGRNVWGQLYWPHIEAKVVGLERNTNPNGLAGTHDSCTLHAAFVDPSHKPHIANFASSGSDCLPGALSTLTLAYNPSRPQEAVRARFPAWSMAVALISFLLALACLAPYFRIARRATVHKA